MFRGNRGRLTVPDIAYLLASLAMLAILYPVWNEGFMSHMSEIDPATAWLFRLMLPLLLLVLLSMLWLKATSGVSR